MKKSKKLTLPVIAIISIIFAIIFGVFYGGNRISANAVPSENANYISAYRAEYDIRADRSVSVTEFLTFNFYGKSGFVREIPVNAGESIKNISVREIDGAGNEKSVYHKVTSESDANGKEFICVDMGSHETKYGKYTFRLKFDYIIPETKDEGTNLLALTPVGSGYEFGITNIDIKLILPEGFNTAAETGYYIGSAQSLYKAEKGIENGREVLKAHIESIPQFTEIRFDLYLADGEFHNYTDFSPYICVIVAAVLLLVMLVVKLLFFKNKQLTPIVNFEAPDNMDPLLMGKIIDNRINNEDITSMIFYFADKGYLKINLDDKDNPTLIRIVQNLPESCPDYEKLIFEGLFFKGDAVKPDQIAGSFSKTVEKVVSRVNASAKGLYTSKSMSIATVFAVLAGLLLGIVPFAVAFFEISKSFMFIAPFIAVIPVLVIFGASQTVKWYSLKLSKTKQALFSALIAAGCLIVSALYALFVPHWIMGFVPKFLLCAICCAMSALSVLIVTRSDNYVKQLNEILGFKNFILLAEKDRLEKMLEDDPQFYYHILPYAQVLGVSDKWEEKFAEITVQPPQWMVSDAVDTVFRIHLFNSIINSSMASMSRSLVSRSSTGASGGISGHFGGFSGGGHGGGGGHFR